MRSSETDSSYSVSVVIPAYNAQRYIGRAIDSVLGQTHPAQEIIVVDDGSTDGTCSVVEGYGDRVRLIRQDNAGAGAARNAGITTGQGEWIAFLDADDEWLPEKLALQMDQLARHGALDWTCSNFFEASQNQPRQLARNPDKAQPLLIDRAYFNTYFDAYVAGFYAWTSTIVARRRLLIDAGLFAENMPRAQDTDLWFRMAYYSPRIGYLTEPLAVYYLSTPASITKVLGQRDAEVLSDLINRHLALSNKHGFGGQFRECASWMLLVLMGQLARKGRRGEIGRLLDMFGTLLPWRFRTEMYLRVHWPRTASVLLPMIASVKKLRRGITPHRDRTSDAPTVTGQASPLPKKTSHQEQHP